MGKESATDGVTSMIKYQIFLTLDLPHLRSWMTPHWLCPPPAAPAPPPIEEEVPYEAPAGSIMDDLFRADEWCGVWMTCSGQMSGVGWRQDTSEPPHHPAPVGCPMNGILTHPHVPPPPENIKSRPEHEVGKHVQEDLWEGDTRGE